jgi:hypothetical protein
LVELKAASNYAVRPVRPVVRGVLLGALLGGLVGIVTGFVLYAIFGDRDSLAVYEVAAGLFGFVFGGGLGAFYGGALSLPRDRQ